MNLFCFPWSGGSAQVYRRWATSLAAQGIDVIGMQPPGRGERDAEPLCDQMRVLAEDAANTIRAHSGPFALFGHSFGALLAGEVAQQLESTGVCPELVVLSACRTPDDPTPVVMHQLSDDELIERIVSMGGCTFEHFRESAFRERFLTVCRADLAAAENYRGGPDWSIGSPLSAWSASEDWYAPPHMVARWADVTGPAFQRRSFQGNHFFVGNRELVLAALIEDLDWARGFSLAVAA